MGNAPVDIVIELVLELFYLRRTGMGIGRKMLELLCEIAKEKGIEQLELEVVADNDRAIALYKKIGLRKWAHFRII